jgi:GR25 family glycosyltransferase involved in LPS biosynthesis
MFASKSMFNVHRYIATVGKQLELSTTLANSKLLKYIENNETQKGHLGALCSHLGVLQGITKSDPFIVVEDDITLSSDFHDRLKYVLENQPSKWDIILLGYLCDEQYFKEQCQCTRPKRLNLKKTNLVKPEYFVGMWGYMVNGAKSAQKILSLFQSTGSEWVIDHDISRRFIKKLDVYATIPHLIYHPGTIRVTPHAYEVTTPFADNYVSDTNS